MTKNLLTLVGAILVTLLLALLVSSPRSDTIAAFFPPWWSAARTFAAASSAGRVSASGPFGSILIVRGAPLDLGPRLRAAGALFLVNSPAVFGCTSRI